MKKAAKIIGIIAGVIIIIVIIAAISSPSESLTSLQKEAVQTYASEIIDKLDALYTTFEEGETQAKRISDERQAPYNIAIGYMAEVRKTVDEIDAIECPTGGQEIKNITISKLQAWQSGLNEIASKDETEVSLSDPHTFYIAYLDVLIEIPELKQDIQKLLAKL